MVAIDAKTFDDLRRQWPFPRSLHGRVVRRLHAAGARAIVYDVQFTEPTEPREDVALYRALGDTGGAVLATSESDGRGHTQVLGGDENLRARALARRRVGPEQRRSRRDHPLSARRGRSGHAGRRRRAPRGRPAPGAGGVR